MKKISQILAEIQKFQDTSVIEENDDKPVTNSENVVIQKFEIGNMVECDIGLAEIVGKGPNYVTLVKEGKTFRRWTVDVTLSKDQRSKRTQVYKDSFIIKGYKTKNFTKELAEQFRLAYKNCDDKFAIFTCAICCDRLLGASPESLIEKFDVYCVDFDRATKYAQKIGVRVQQLDVIEDILFEHALSKDIRFSCANKNKVAQIFAMVVESDCTGNYIDVVHRAVDHVKRHKYSSGQWKTIGSLLNKITESGIKWDKSKLHQTTQRYMGLK